MINMTKGIRGAISVEDNSPVAIKKATIELLETIIEKNNIDKELISHVIFTLTPDINAAFPAKFAREEMEFNEVAMLCFKELDVPNAIKKCLRILLVLNCAEDFTPEHIYLKKAKALRPDIEQ